MIPHRLQTEIPAVSTRAHASIHRQTARWVSLPCDRSVGLVGRESTSRCYVADVVVCDAVMVDSEPSWRLNSDRNSVYTEEEPGITRCEEELVSEVIFRSRQGEQQRRRDGYT